MNKLLSICVAILIGYLFYTNLKDSLPEKVPVTQVAGKTPLSPSAPSPAARKQSAQSVAANNWPGINSDAAVPILESNLTRQNIVLIFDGSGSMGETRCSGTRNKCDAAKAAVNEWASSVPADANLGLIVFDQQGLSVRLPLGHGSRDQFREQIDKIVPNYKTPLTASIGQAYKMLTDQGRKQLGYGEYTIVIVTDGAADNPNHLTQSVNSILDASPILFSTIGFCISTNHSLNQPGKTAYKSASDPESLRKGLQEVLAESESFDISAFQ